MDFLKMITALSVLVAAGFAIAGLVNPAFIAPDVNTTDVFALYAAARAIPLAILTIIVIFRNDGKQLEILAIVAAVIQLMDGCIGIYMHEPSKYIGPFILAIAGFFAVYKKRAL